MGKLSQFIFRKGQRVDVADLPGAPEKPVPSTLRAAVYDKDLADQYQNRRKTALADMFGGHKDLNRAS